MPSILEYKLRKSLDNELKKRAVIVDENVLEALVSSSLLIVAKMESEQSALRLRQYQHGLETERNLMRSIIDAKENIGEPEYLIYREIRKYLFQFKKTIIIDDND